MKHRDFFEKFNFFIDGILMINDRPTDKIAGTIFVFETY